MGSGSFRSRHEAGVQLGEKLMQLGLREPLVFAIPKMGLPVARAIAERLGSTLDMAPSPDFENHESTEFSSVTADAKTAQRAQTASSNDLENHDLVIVDDVIANGAGALAAIRGLREREGARIVVAAAVISHEGLSRLTQLGVEVCAVHIVESNSGLNEFFADEDGVSDHEVLAVSSDARGCRKSGGRQNQWVQLPLGETIQTAKWSASSTICGVVVILNTDDQADETQRTIEAASRQLEASGYGTLTLTLSRKDGDVAVLAHRIRQVANWLEDFGPAENLPLGYFGVGLGGAAMLEAAAATPERVKAMVCYESPLHLVEDFCARVHAPTLLVLQSEESSFLSENRTAMKSILVEKSLSLLNASSGEAHESVGNLAESWLTRFLAPGGVVRKTRPSQAALPLQGQALD